MTRILVEQLPESPSAVEIEGAELHYLTRVRRHGVGDLVEVRDSRGRRYRARVDRVSRSSALLIIEEELAAAPVSWPVTLIVAVPKGRLLDGVVRQASELGIARICPVLAERSTARPSQGRHERWQRIAAEAARQCGRAEPLKLEDTSSLADALERAASAPIRLILDPGSGDQGLADRLSDRTAPDGAVAVVVGPEGGFTGPELDLARRLGYEPVGLGSTILRIETAAVAAATLAVAFAGGFD
jgi:16S rRNA (uracil1498-N3)-methyltransferase